MKISDLGFPRLEAGVHKIKISNVRLMSEGRNGAYKSPMIEVTTSEGALFMVPSRGPLVQQLIISTMTDKEIEKANSLLELCGLMTGRVCSVSMQQMGTFVNPIEFNPI